MYLASRGCEVTLLDYTPSALKVARENFAREGLPAPHVVLADARATGLQPESYDVVYSLGLLEHFDDPVPVLREMLRVLKPGGYVYALVVPQRPPKVKFLAYGLFAPWRLAVALTPPRIRRMAKRILGRGGSNEAIPLRTGFQEKDYQGMLAREGVADLQCWPYNPYHEVYASPAAERRILVPAYRLHHAIRKRFAKPSAKTAGAFAACLLLTCRKPA
jgi:SAM-dependent methyltransferase